MNKKFLIKVYVLFAFIFALAQFVSATETLQPKIDNNTVVKQSTVTSNTVTKIEPIVAEEKQKTINSTAKQITISSDTTKSITDSTKKEVEIVKLSSDTTKSVNTITKIETKDVIVSSNTSKIANDVPNKETIIATTETAKSINDSVALKKENIVSSDTIKIVNNKKVETTEKVETIQEDNKQIEEFDIEKIKIPSQPNYANKSNWAILPSGRTNNKVDVFYVYPTIFGGNGYELMDVKDGKLRKRAKNYSLFNTGIFNSEADIYAPYYRQASIELLNLDAEDVELFLSTGLNDVKTAFKYYLKHYNNGKPFILAGFSQGSEIILDIMKTMFHDENLQKQLVAAYIIGYSVTENDIQKYPFLKMAKNSKDYGVIISYNTQTAGSGYSKVHINGAQSINPVTWKTNNKPAKEKYYKGAVIFNIETNKTIKDTKPFNTVYLEKGTNALIVDADTSKYNMGKGLFQDGVLHMYDYMFFYNNLKENVQERIHEYLGIKK